MRRQSELNARHKALGASLDRAWNGMPVAERYRTDPYDEVAAVRYRGGLIDISSHNLVTIAGDRAAQCLNAILTTDITRLMPGQTHCSNIVGEDGGLIDDVLVYCDSENRFRLSHGEGRLQQVLSDVAPAYGVTFAPDDDTHVLSLQGPRSTGVLSPLVTIDLSELPLGRHRPTELFGRQVSMTRGGFFGETGFEIFCARADAVTLWDGLLQAGEASGIIPISWRCLEIARIEAGLLFFPYDMPYPDTTPWEVDAGWTVDLDKDDFRGKAALRARRDKIRSCIAGVEIRFDDAVPTAARIASQGRDVGCVTSAVFSRHLMKSIAMVQIAPEVSALGTLLEIRADGNVWPAHVVQMPFYDPMRRRTAL